MKSFCAKNALNQLLTDFIFFLLLTTSSISLATSDESKTTVFRGHIMGKVTEINQHEYTFFESSESIDKELFIGLDQNKGQKLFWSKKGRLVESAADNKYLVSTTITETDNETFDANIKLFITAPKNKTNQTTSIATKEIATYQVKGSLNAKNEYNFIDDGKHNFYLRIEIDKIFTEKEKKARLLKKLAVAN